MDESINTEISNLQKEQQLQDAITIMGDRLDGMGVAEPIIRALGDDSIIVEIAGLSTKDNPEVIDALKKPAKLEFKKVHPSIIANKSNLEECPPGYEVLYEAESKNMISGDSEYRPYFVRSIPEAEGDIIEKAVPYQNETGGWEVGLTMTTEGAKEFRKITEKLIGKPLAIVLDGKLYSAPTVQSALSKRAQITGSFSQREAYDLANALNNPLAIELSVEEMYEIGPKLASSTRDSSISAVKYGAVLVIVFMIIYYFSGGLIAVLSSIVNVTLVLGILASIGATLTLPGVAALVLTLGMGVDANILILERIREELRQEKSIESSLNNGFKKVISTILDANITTLITALILYWLGSGLVKGFGLTMAVGIIASVFCALFITRTLANLLVFKLGFKNLLGLNLLPKKKIDFFRFPK